MSSEWLEPTKQQVALVHKMLQNVGYGLVAFPVVELSDNSTVNMQHNFKKHFFRHGLVNEIFSARLLAQRAQQFSDAAKLSSIALPPGQDLADYEAGLDSVRNDAHRGAPKIPS